MVDTDVMIALFTLLGAVLGYTGSIISGYLSGRLSYKGAMKAVQKEISFEYKKLRIEKEEKEEIALSIIKTFLLDEIKRNYDTAKGIDPKQTYLNILRREETDSNRRLSNNSFSYDDYNKVKYDLVKYNSTIIKDVIDIYRTFKYLQNNSGEVYNSLPENDKKMINNGIIKCEKLIKS